MYKTFSTKMEEKAYDEWVAKTRAKQAELRKGGMTCVSPPPTRSEDLQKREALKRRQEEHSRRMSLPERMTTSAPRSSAKSDEENRNSEGNDQNESTVSSKLNKIMADRAEQDEIVRKLLHRMRDQPVEQKIKMCNAARFNRTKEMLETAQITESELFEGDFLKATLPILGYPREAHSSSRKHGDDRYAPYGLSRRDGSRHEDRRVLGSSSSSQNQENRQKDPREYFKKSAYTWKSIGQEGSEPDQKDPRQYFKKSKFTWKTLQ